MAKVAFWTPVSNEAPWEELLIEKDFLFEKNYEPSLKKTSWLVFLKLPSSRALYFMSLSNATSKVDCK